MDVIWKDYITTDRDSKFPMRPIGELDERSVNFSACEN